MVLRTCEECGSSFKTKASRVSVGKGKFCSTKCRWKHQTDRDGTPEAIARRFWEKVEKNGPVLIEELGPCWIWQGDEASHGYGYCLVNGVRIRAHRFSYELAHGEIPEGLIVRHQCDNPACVNPEHLLLGDHGDNMRDMRERGRASPPPIHRGEANPATKLTAESVREIRARYAAGETTQEKLAEEFGVLQTTISMIVRRKKWTHVGDTDATIPSRSPVVAGEPVC